MKYITLACCVALVGVLLLATAGAAPRGGRGGGQGNSRGRGRGNNQRGAGRGRGGNRKETEDVTVLTFNTGMFSPTPSNAQTHELRKLALLSGIRSSSKVWRDTDVVCLQELRRLEDFESVSCALRSAGFHFQHSFLDSLDEEEAEAESGATACENTTAVDQFVTCASSGVCQTLAALGLPLPLVATCVFYLCPQYEQLSQSCVECFLDHRQPTVSNYAANAERCKLAPKADYLPTRGLLLASRRPMYAKKATRFVPGRTNFLAYGYLQAKVSHDLSGAGMIDCQMVSREILSETERPRPFRILQMPAHTNEVRQTELQQTIS